MPQQTNTTTRASLWPGLLTMILFVLVPYSYAAFTGTPQPETSGLARVHSAAESIYCVKGISPVTSILLIELAVLLIVVLWAWLKQGEPGGKTAVFHQHGWYLFTLALLIAIPFIIAWQTNSSPCTRGKAFFWQSIYIDVFILAILALSYNLMFGFTGVVSFGHAAFFGTGAYAVGLFMKHLEWPWWLAILASLLLGILIALIKGFVGLRIKGLYFALFTLAFAEVFFLLAGNRIMVNITGAEDGFTFTVPDWLNMTKNRLFFYYLTLTFLTLAFITIYRLMHSPTGSVLSALQDNEERAQMIGYNTFHFKLLAIVLAGIMATMAGILRGLALKGASPNVLGLDFTMNPLLMSIVGGVATFSGPVIGAFMLRLTEQLLRDSVITIGTLSLNIGDHWTLILGIIFILSVMAFPHGIVGTWLSKNLHTRNGWITLFQRPKTNKDTFVQSSHPPSSTKHKETS